MRKYDTYYGDYLHLPKLLDSQHPLSAQLTQEAHDETLFIIVHQVYELWFKQILHELNSIVETFSNEIIEEKKLFKVVQRMERIQKIQGLLIAQIPVMETMTPMDFLEFRDLLMPASGFQSVQFREIEICLGLDTSSRMSVDREYFIGRLSEQDRARIDEIESRPSLLSLVEKWLERTPFLNKEEFSFWKAYRGTVQESLMNDKEAISKNPTLNEKAKEIQVENLLATIRTFKSLFDSDEYQKLLDLGKRKISQKAILGALFISLYREEPILQLPYKFLTSLIDIDEGFTAWRYRHAFMAHRMLGTKIGTGGSSGHHYLKMAAENNRIYTDLFDLATFLVPKSSLPELPKELLKELNFYYE